MTDRSSSQEMVHNELILEASAVMLRRIFFLAGDFSSFATMLFL